MTDGESIASPAATRRTAWMISGGAVSFNRNPSAPARSAYSTNDGGSCAAQSIGSAAVDASSSARMSRPQCAGTQPKTTTFGSRAQLDDPVVGETMHKDVDIADVSDPLEGALQRLQDSSCPILPVLRNQQLVGLLTAENLGEFVIINNARSERNTRAAGVAEVTA